MKKKFGILLFSCLLALLFTSCDEVLSVVTANESGEKIVNNYVSMFDDTVYDESISLKSWHNIGIFTEEKVVQMDDLLFKIENKKENLVVLGDKDAAVEIRFFEGGYKYTLFSSMDSLNLMFNF
ncbi:hypothetical protein H0R94_09765 [Treponema socranskii]|uniref:hypothetical protein n=1 Tax=Treponema socranskii TaxID=53419 RepID=UPI003D90FF1D